MTVRCNAVADCPDTECSARLEHMPCRMNCGPNYCAEVQRVVECEEINRGTKPPEGEEQ